MIKLVDYDNINDLSLEVIKLDVRESLKGFKFCFINKKNNNKTCFYIHSYRKALILYNYLYPLFKIDKIKNNYCIQSDWFTLFVNYLYHINTYNDMYVQFKESYNASSILAFDNDNNFLFAVEEIRNFIKINKFVKIPIKEHKEIYKKNTIMVKIYLLELVKKVRCNNTELWLPLADDSLFPS